MRWLWGFGLGGRREGGVEPGGGGFGPAAQRSPARLADDMREGFVTLEAARRDYGFSG